MTDTATCSDCPKAWRGPWSLDQGIVYEKEVGHVVWYDQDPDTTEIENWEGVQDNFEE